MGTISLYAPTPYVHHSGSKIFEFNLIFFSSLPNNFFSQPVCFIVQHPRFFFEFLLICNKIQIIMIIEVTSYRWVQCMKMRWKVIRRLIYIIKVGFFSLFGEDSVGVRQNYIRSTWYICTCIKRPAPALFILRKRIRAT